MKFHRIVPTWLASFVPLVALGGSAFARAQDLPCGTVIDPVGGAQGWVQQQMGAYQVPVNPWLPQVFGNGPYLVPLSFHVVRDSNGSGGLSQARLDQALIDANIAFAPMGIEFCAAGPVDEIWSNAFYYDIDTLAEINALRSTNWVPGTVNIYFTENLASEGGGLCGISAFTFSAVQGIAMANSCTATTTNHSTFPHEIGHYFDLFHTHEPFYGLECVNGSNCSIAGDLVCDTPADPVLSNASVNSSCVYVGSQVDSCSGANYAPQTENLMSYSRKECRTLFTAGQNARGLATLLNLRPELIVPVCGGGIAQFCSPAVVNSAGTECTLSATGSGAASNNDLTLHAQGLPAERFAYFLNGQATGSPVIPPGGMGQLCLTTSIGRYNALSQILYTGSGNQVELALDLTSTPTAQGPVPILSGQTWYFQLWYRDVVQGSSTNNFSTGLAVTFQ